MNETYNPSRPLIMHIDLNSCFATVEQQARPCLRGRPVAVVNRRTEHTMIVTASYEAKKSGVKLGMRLRDAKKLCPELVNLPKHSQVFSAGQTYSMMKGGSAVEIFGEFRVKGTDLVLVFEREQAKQKRFR